MPKITHGQPTEINSLEPDKEYRLEFSGDDEGNLTNVRVIPADNVNEADAVGCIHKGAFYLCRDGSIVGPMIDDVYEPSFGYAAALGGKYGELWDDYGWSREEGRERDLISEAKPPLTWTGKCWVQNSQGK